MKIGIICATDDELHAVLATGSAGPPRLIAGEAFHPLHAAEGCEAVVTRTEIGKVNAVMAATLLVAHPEIASELIVVVGVAGALKPGLRPGDTVVGASLGCHDYGVAAPEGFWPVRPGVFPLGAPRAKLEPVHPLAARLADDLIEAAGEAEQPGHRLIAGGILSGDQFITSDAVRDGLRRDFGADAVDMESHAVFQVGQRFGVPVLVLRSVSDSAGDEAKDQYGSVLAETCDRAAGFLGPLFRILAGGGYAGRRGAAGAPAA